MVTILGDSVSKRILIDGCWYICNLSHRDNIQYWTCCNAKKVAEALEKNGLVVVSIDDSDLPEKIEVDTSRYHVWNYTYHLNQCEDLLEWIRTSKAGEFTNYYDKVVFHHPEGKFIAAYRDDINNFWYI